MVTGGVLVLLATTGVAAGAQASNGFATSARHGDPTSSVQSVITSVQVARHSGFDRVVFTFEGAQPGYDVAYASRITEEPSGRRIAMRGDAALRVVLRPTSTITPAPQPNLNPNFPRLKQVRGAGDFEALTVYALGLSERAPFRVMRLAKPNRLVIDVATSAPTLPQTGDVSDSLPLAFTGLTLLLAGLAMRVASLQPATQVATRPGQRGRRRLFPAPAQALRLYSPGTGRRRQTGRARPPASAAPSMAPERERELWPQTKGQHRKAGRQRVQPLSRPAPRHGAAGGGWRLENPRRRDGWLGLIERTADLSQSPPATQAWPDGR